MLQTLYCEKCGTTLKIKDKTFLGFEKESGEPTRRGKYVYTCPNGSKKKGHTRVVSAL